MRSRLQHFALVVALFFMIMLLVYGQQEPSEPDRPGILSDIEPRQDPREPDKPGILSHVEPRQDPREPDKPGILSHVERRQEPSEPDRPGVASHLYRRQMPDPPLTTSGMSSEFDGVDGPLDPEAVPASMMNITSSDIGTSSCEVSPIRDVV
ncbi:hypothetical protein BGZ73_001377 [Actinomortierella ambigua]|nr:hypothetical protein BGZ73_001377 [Actinomortierella ambigua]